MKHIFRQKRIGQFDIVMYNWPQFGYEKKLFYKALHIGYITIYRFKIKEDKMYTFTIADKAVKRYKCQWYSWNINNEICIKKTMILHAENMPAVGQKAWRLYGSKPDRIIRI